MGNAINSATELAGVKLFKGGPYADRGLGEAPKKAGQQMLSMGLGALPSLFAQIAGTSGVVNPFATATGSGTGTTAGGATGGTTEATTGYNNPYGLSPTQMAGYNEQAGLINARRKSALDALTSSQASRGLSSSTAKATAQLINRMADDEQNSIFANFATQAQQERMQGLAQLFSAAQNMIGTGTGTLQNAAANAANMSGQGMANLTSFLSTLAGIPGLMPGTGGGGGAGAGAGASPYLGGTFGSGCPAAPRSAGTPPSGARC